MKNKEMSHCMRTRARAPRAAACARCYCTAFTARARLRTALRTPHCAPARRALLRRLAPLQPSPPTRYLCIPACYSTLPPFCGSYYTTAPQQLACCTRTAACLFAVPSLHFLCAFTFSAPWFSQFTPPLCVMTAGCLLVLLPRKHCGIVCVYCESTCQPTLYLYCVVALLFICVYCGKINNKCIEKLRYLTDNVIVCVFVFHLFI